MTDIQRLATCCGVLIRASGADFEHVATAWSLAPGEWVTAWPGEAAPGDGLCLLTAEGICGPAHDWEIDNGIAGFRGPVASAVFEVERAAELSKRMPLLAFAYPSVIDHPAFRLHRGSLTPERYFPYLCPWAIDGHCALFTAEDGWITGRLYAGMAGGPVLDGDGRVVGILWAGGPSPEHPPLTAFRRLA